MSSRILRKFRQENDFSANIKDEKNSDSDLESTGVKKKQPNVNRYNLLIQQSHSDSEAKEDDSETEKCEEVAEVEDNTSDSTRRRKKKKRRKPEVRNRSSRRSSEDNLDLEECLKELGLSVPPAKTISKHQQLAENSSAITELLQVTRRHLNPNNELKKKFGSKIVESEQRRRSHGHGYKRLTWLVTPRENWPSPGKTGLSMKCSSILPNGIMNFDFEHSDFYQKIQVKFFEAVDSYHPENIVSVSHKHPYHVDTLIQLSELCKLSEDLQMAAELNERALYCLESAFHANFNPATGKCRLDYRTQENRALYVTLFNHIMFVSQRGCHRTALELCKLLLSLDPDGDPLGVLLCVDLFALRSHSYQWLIDLNRVWETSRNLSQLPNHAFSLALAHFRLGSDQADALLQNSLLMFPGVLPLLLEKCSVQADPRIAKHTFFQPGSEHSSSLMQLMQLSVHRNHLLWKDKAVLDWLMDCAVKVVSRVDAGDPLVKEYKSKRELRYEGMPRNVLRHIVLSGIKEVRPMLPENLQGGMLTFDPLPPSDSRDLYTRVQRARPQAGGSGANTNILTTFFRSLMPTFTMEHNGHGEYDIVIHPGRGGLLGDEEAGGGGAGAGAGAGAVAGAVAVAGAGPATGAAALELRQSVTSLVDAMRDLLSNVHLPHRPPPPAAHTPSSDYEVSTDTDSADDGFEFFHAFEDDESSGLDEPH